MKKILVSPWTSIITLAVIVFVSMQQPTFLESVKLRYFDTLITSQPEQQLTIHTVNIDEAALEKYGQWPFSRDIYSDIIKDLYARGAGLVVWNIMMPEADRLGGDDVLANTLKEYPVILPNVASDKNKNQARFNPNVVIGDPTGKVVEYPGIISNIPSLEETAYGVGIVNTFPEVDGVVRRTPMVILSDGKLYPSMSMEIMRVLAGDPSFQIKFNELGIEKMRIPQFGPISTDQVGRIWIDWQQRPQQNSLMALPDNFDSAIVIVGPTASGIANPVPTSRGAVWPQDMQAAVVGTLVQGINIQRPDWASGSELLALVVLSLILLFLTRWVYVGLGASIVVLGAIVPATGYLYANYLMLFDATLVLGGGILVVLHAYGVKFVSEFLQKQAIKKQFAGYASPTVVRLLQENPSLIKDGMKREISICFSDLRGFTPLGESFGDDVKGLTKIMNGYMDAITQPILDADGMVIKYIGDASMHVHNAPNDDPDHAKSAVQTGLNMLQAVREFNDKIVAEGRPPVGMGAGINTGLGYLGEMGSSARHSYDVLGDAVSTAARIESKCKEYGCLLLVGESTYDKTKDDFFYLQVDELAVKGKTVGIRIYTVLDDPVSAYYSSQQKHQEMYQAYQAQQFDQAIKMCQLLKSHFEGQMQGYYNMWIERCEYMLTQDLPKDWNGVFIATTK
ncbi:adenylate/guanylate cyclase domain-containing protein [Methylophilaceae bacterium]|nr:adenylate/guanylate cyclase domain-containing protein [Methylophilaceae bacterium]